MWYLQVLKGIKDLTDVVKNKPAYMGRDFDATRKAITETIESKGRIERNHQKLNIQ